MGLWRRADANSDQRRVRSALDRATGSASFTEELRLIARGAAISGHQDLIVLTLHRASRNAIRPDDADTRARRTRLAFFTLWTGRSGGTRRTGRAGIAFRALRAGRALLTLRTFAAARHARELNQHHCQMRHAHCHILLGKAAPHSLLKDQTRQLGTRTDACTDHPGGWQGRNALFKLRMVWAKAPCWSCEENAG
jgi:hypothetical protein